MNRTAARQRTFALISARSRIRSQLRELGIKLDERYWAWPTQSGYTDHRGMDWVGFLQPLSQFARDNPDLGNSLRWLMACWLTGCGGEFLPVLPVTALNRIRAVRRLLLALLAKHRCIETITPSQVQAVMRGFFLNGERHCTAGARTLRLVLHAAHDLYRLRAYLPVGFSVDPFPPGFAQNIIPYGKRSDPWVAPPEPVCLELIRQALRLLGKPAEDVIRLRRKYLLACEPAKKRRERQTVRKIARRALRGERFATLPGEDQPWTTASAEHPAAIKHLVEVIEGACATVLLFLSGPRVSEIQRARPGCLRYIRHSNGIEYPYYFARRSKRKSSPAADVPDRIDQQGRGWILGPAGVRALDVLEQLSREVRRISGVDSYWAAIRCSGLWSCTDSTTVTAAAPPAINNRLNVFASLIGLAELTGWRGRLHSHMGRKACARFIAKRDRTALADLAVQFGHLSAYVTDVGYAWPDAEYRRMIDEELAAEMQETAVELAGLDPSRTFSNMGEPAVAALRDRVAHFVGELYSTSDVKRLLGSGVRLVPCDWGMCIYREETSACHGNQFGPSSERRSPVICRKCINFLATGKHRPYWQRRIEDCERVLALRAIPDQVRQLVRLRMAEAQEVISSIAGHNTHE